ncbi:TatD family hydrolase [Flavobacteriales bacterium]|jgi:TatD DNase family protein|nr:TatD family hydrolase [Flavobacteriales bacterium]MDA7596266.1 TatD family hydrolase [Flavobacteriales bacterium]MDC1069158.1 TatD family hydrolase [Flavobacteriales bacterium]|tara:strand:+ start:50 stop:823 length:774 start_codon:yes stop_codon:yes gene_type:complete
MKFIDTHSHLYSEQFDNDRITAINEAIALGIDTILLPNISSKYTNNLLKLCNQFPENCFPMMGLHPCDVSEENFDSEMQHVEIELAKNKYIAVGEIGLDLYWDKTKLEVQKRAFIHQIKLAKQYQIPIAIHVRDAFDEAIEIVESHNDNTLRGVFHCFTGSIVQAERVIDLKDFYLGIGGVITFKNSGLDQTIKEISLKNLILETDSPYLAPVPFRGKRNESKYLTKIAEKIAEIKNMTIKEIAEITTTNAKKLFHI